jgi:phage baseplate assembly protein W
MASLADIDVYGRTTTDGSPKIQKGDNAISNALVLYLTSRRGDFVNQPDFGGPLEFMLFKNLNKDTDEIETKITNEINRVFGNLVTLQDVSVQPDYLGRQWVVDVIYKSNATGDLSKVQYFVNSSQGQFSPPNVFQSNRYVDIHYSGENLYNFVLLKKEEVPGERLVKNADDNLYYWGFYKFPNLLLTDPYFAQIEFAINGF